MVNTVAGESSSLVHRSLWRLYLLRFLGAWGTRQWWFGCGIFVFWLRPRDLQLSACLGLSHSLALWLFGSWLGVWIDNSKRMLAVKVFLGIENICIAAACTAVACFFNKEKVRYNPILFGIIVIALAVISGVAFRGNKIVVAKDWLGVISQSKHEDEGARINLIFQSIDLGCKTVAPIFVGLMIELTSLKTTAIVLAVWSIVSVMIEWKLMDMIFKEYPKLLTSKRRPSNEGDREAGWQVKLGKSLESWKLYMTHSTRNAGLTLALIYMTVLSFGDVIWAYSLLQCVPEYLLSILCGLAAINEILGAMAFWCLRVNLGADVAGHVGLFFLLAALVPCVVSLFLPGSPWILLNRKVKEDDWQCRRSLSIYILLLGVVAERFGAWLSHIAVTQIQRQEVEEDVSRSIKSVQETLIFLFELIKYVLVLILPRAGDFGYLVCVSFLSIVLGNILYATYTIPKVCWPRKMSSRSSEIIPLLSNFPYTPPSTIATPSPQTLANFII